MEAFGCQLCIVLSCFWPFVKQFNETSSVSPSLLPLQLACRRHITSHPSSYRCSAGIFLRLVEFTWTESWILNFLKSDTPSHVQCCLSNICYNILCGWSSGFSFRGCVWCRKEWLLIGVSLCLFCWSICWCLDFFIIGVGLCLFCCWCLDFFVVGAGVDFNVIPLFISGVAPFSWLFISGVPPLADCSSLVYPGGRWMLLHFVRCIPLPTDCACKIVGLDVLACSSPSSLCPRRHSLQ